MTTRSELHPVVPNTDELIGGAPIEEVEYFTNDHIANHLEAIKDMLQKAGDLQRVYAYSRASSAIRSHSIPVAKMDLKPGDIKYVGPAVIGTIEEYIECGTSNKYRELIKQYPPLPESLKELEAVSGLGPKKIEKLYSEHGVTNLAALQALLETNSEIGDDKLRSAVKIAMTEEPRIPFAEANAIAQPILLMILSWPEVVKARLAGSMRRELPTVKDIDIVVAVEDQHRTSLRDKIKATWPADVYADGANKTRLRVSDRQLDIVFSSVNSWGCALSYFTGSKEFNVRMRELAASKGLRLNEFGLYERKTDMLVSGCPTEEFLYQLLGLKYVEPYERTPERKLESLL